MSIRLKEIEKASLICSIILAFIFCLALYVRTAIPYTSIFTGEFVRFGGYDPWYHMRLVENTLHHFPHRISFDPYTYYPHGATVHFPPLFDQLLVFIIWVIGAGNPLQTLGQHGIEVIAAWYPAILGALTVIPVYLIGKELWNKGAGLLSAALIAILPGQFLARSLLGFVDHHVAETLFSTIAMLFIILALKSAKENGITFYTIRERDWSSLKKPMSYSLLGGVFLGCYFLSWVGAPFFVFVLLIYAVVQHIADHLRGVSTEYLSIVAMPVFLVPLAMILPVLQPSAFTEFQILSLQLGMAVFLILSMVSFLMNRKQIVYGYPIAVLVLGLVLLILLSVLNPSLYSALTGRLGTFFPSETLLTIKEAHPMEWDKIWIWFATTFYIAFLAFPWLGYNIVKKWRAEEILFVVWSAVMLFACFGQNRFAAYYAVNVALLCGFLSWAIIELVWFRGEEKEGGGIEETRKQKEEKSKEKGKKHKSASNKARRARAKAKGAKAEKKEERAELKKFLRADIIITILVIGFAVFYPTLDVAVRSAKNPGGLIPGPANDWYEALSWMRENTPDPGVDYYALYDVPEGGGYDYQESAYSVMSWWENGHWITRIAHRIPVANNFQQGIGGHYQGNRPGASVFFTAGDEEKANEIADALDVRYVVSEFGMADISNIFANKFSGIAFWAGDTEGYYVQEVETVKGSKLVPSAKYISTMVARLHISDGRSVFIEESGLELEPLHHYRLIHESPSTIMSMDGQEIKFIKVFEYVKGARIEGRAPEGSIIVMATSITTNQGREFGYAQRTISTSNGTFEFIVPYSTEGPMEGGTNFDVLATPYEIGAGHIKEEDGSWVLEIEKEVKVNEREVVEGRTIRVDLRAPA